MAIRGVIILAIVAWSGIAAAVVNRLQDDPEPVVAAPATIQRVVFDDRWDWNDTVLSPLKKTDRIAPVRLPEAIAVPAISVKVETVKPVERHVERDVCQRHGMRKVWHVRRHWKSWRCR